jgi:hypothetical protein
MVGAAIAFSPAFATGGQAGYFADLRRANVVVSLRRILTQQRSPSNLRTLIADLLASPARF